MDRLTFTSQIVERLDELKALLTSKGDEYANTADVHHNFKDATGLSLHNKPQQILWEYCVKHLQSIRDIINGKEVDYSTVKEKTGDVIAYMLLLESMYTPPKPHTLTESSTTDTWNDIDKLKYTYWDEDNLK